MKIFVSGYIACFVSVILLLLGGCTAVQNPTNVPKTISPTNKPVATETLNIPTFTPTISPTIMLTPTATLIPTITLTPLPTLSEKDAYVLMMNLLKDNGGCKLPCWWGIMPGKTTWDDAQRFLETFTSIGIVDRSDDFFAYAYLPLPAEKGTLDHSYHVKNGVVYSIGAYNFDWAPSLYLSNFLTTYGPPDEIFISTFRNGLDRSWPYMLDLFYADKGIWMEYSGGESNIVGETLRNCFDNMDSPFINLWSPDEKMTSSGAIQHFFDTRNMPYPIPLEKATGMTVDAFYNKFKVPDKRHCLETPLTLWPPY